MKHVVRKAYYDYEKEEKWINQMSAMGMVLIDYSWCRYVFTQGNPNEYVYRIELLEKDAKEPESQAYIQFLEENGIECVATYMRWVYLRKKAADGPFDNYSDIQSKLSYLKRIYGFWTTLIWLQFGAGAINLICAALNQTIINLIAGLICIGFSLCIYKMNTKTARKIRALTQESFVKE